MLSKVFSLQDILEHIHDGQTIMFGDWHGQFAADEIIDGMLEKGIKDIKAIAVSAGYPGQGVGKLIVAHRVSSIVTTHIGLNPEALKQMLVIDGKEYLLELPLHADVALVKATKADTAGNLYFRMNSRATNSTIAYAADFVAAEVEEIVPVGQLLPEKIAIPAPVVDMVYERQGEKRFICPMWKKARARAEAKARERQERG